jgi:hypothetical protein
MPRLSAWLLLSALVGATGIPTRVHRNMTDGPARRTLRRADVKITKRVKGFEMDECTKLTKITELLRTYHDGLEEWYAEGESTREEGSGEDDVGAKSDLSKLLEKAEGMKAECGFTILVKDQLIDFAGEYIGSKTLTDHGLEFGTQDFGVGKNKGQLEVTEGDGEAVIGEGDMGFANQRAYESYMRQGMPGGRRFIKLNSKEAKETTHSTPWTEGKLYYCYSAQAETVGRLVKAVEVGAKQFNKAVPCTEMIRVERASATQCASPTGNAVMVTAENQGCWSYVGMIGGTQKLNLASGCEAMGVVVHEFLHAFGQSHEQSRPDRDEYVTILWDNIQSGKGHNFGIQQGGDTDRPYDILSLMHYGTGFFSSNGQPTIEAKDKAYEYYTTDPAKFGLYTPGERIGMAQSDADQLGQQYLCEDMVSTYDSDGGCTDIEKNLGIPWTNTAGQTCEEVFDAVGVDCMDDYDGGNGAAAYCCDCNGGLNVHKWLASNAPRSPPPPPSPELPPPAPPRDCLTGCDNDYKCGMCLVALAPQSSECPATEPPKCSAANADSIGLFELCESDGECGGGTPGSMRPEADGTYTAWTGNCPSAHCPVGFDIYKKVECFSPPASPPSPPFSCADCDNGFQCDSCLRLIPTEECPKSSSDMDKLEDCSAKADSTMMPGELCRRINTDTCGTTSPWSNGANCEYPWSYTDDSGTVQSGVWKVNAYKKVDCHQPAAPPSQPPVPSIPPSAPPDAPSPPFSPPPPSAPPGTPSPSPSPPDPPSAPAPDCPYDKSDVWSAGFCQSYSSYCSWHSTVQAKCAFTCAMVDVDAYCPVDMFPQCSSNNWAKHCGKPLCDGTAATCNSRWPSHDPDNKWYCTTCYGISVNGVKTAVDDICPKTCSNTMMASKKFTAKKHHSDRKKSAVGAGAMQAA